MVGLKLMAQMFSSLDPHCAQTVELANIEKAKRIANKNRYDRMNLGIKVSVKNTGDFETTWELRGKNLKRFLFDRLKPT